MTRFLAERGVERGVGRSGRGARVLRVHRQDDQLLDTLLLEVGEGLLQRAGDHRIAARLILRRQRRNVGELRVPIGLLAAFVGVGFDVAFLDGDGDFALGGTRLRDRDVDGRGLPDGVLEVEDARCIHAPLCQSVTPGGGGFCGSLLRGLVRTAHDFGVGQVLLLRHGAHGQVVLDQEGDPQPEAGRGESRGISPEFFDPFA